MSEELKQLIKHMERFNEINKSDIPKLIEEVKRLEDSQKLAWKQLEIIETQLGWIS